MPNDQDQTSPPAAAPNYAERIDQQKALVRDLEDRHGKKPSPELQLELRRKTDTLRHIENLAKGNPKERARKAAETAKLYTLSKAIV